MNSTYYSPTSPQDQIPSPVSVYHPTKRAGTVDSFYIKETLPPGANGWRDQMRSLELQSNYPGPAHHANRNLNRRSRSMTAISAAFVQQEIEYADRLDGALEKRLSRYPDVNVRTGAMRRPSVSTGQRRLI